MGRILKFPSSHLTIYLPHGSSPTDVYEAITITDDSLSRGTVYKGDVVVIKLGLIQPSGLHAVVTHTGSKYVGFLVEKGNDIVSLESNNDEYEPETFRRDEIEILGRVVQVYPGGDIQQRWELIRAPQPAAQKRNRVTKAK
jgi:phage repressor protein C with HTH and peptisase S24 domain